MAVWYPPSSSIGDLELIGRRLIDKASKARSVDEDGKLLFDWNDFIDDRMKDDLSVDRMGDPNPNKLTLKTITKIADIEVKNSDDNRCLSGWATIRVRDLTWPGWTRKISPVPTEIPVSGEKEDTMVKNHWHAEICRDGFREKATLYTFSVTIYHSFLRKGGVEVPIR